MNKKQCSVCNLYKDIDLDFYKCQGRVRSECKKCTIRKNVLYQKKYQSWKHRYVDLEQQRSYMNDYYSKNKLRFAEYRKRFKEKHPDYYKNYAKHRKIDME